VQCGQERTLFEGTREARVEGSAGSEVAGSCQETRGFSAYPASGSSEEVGQTLDSTFPEKAKWLRSIRPHSSPRPNGFRSVNQIMFTARILAGSQSGSLTFFTRATRGQGKPGETHAKP